MAPKTTYIIFPKKATNTPVGQEKVDGLDKLPVLLVRGQVGQSKADQFCFVFVFLAIFSMFLRQNKSTFWFHAGHEQRSHRSESLSCTL